jgi:hypothetical protein
LLVARASHISGGIKYLTHSTWSHSALYVEPMAGAATEDEPNVLFEANIDEGVVSAPLSKYLHCQTRLLNDHRLPSTNLEIDMSKPRLRLIHCSNGMRPGAKHRQHGRSFQPLVIRGGAGARSVPRESSWEAALELIDLGFLISLTNYLAFLEGSVTVFGAHNWTDRERTS